MQTVTVVRYISIVGIVLTFIGACIKTGGDGTSLMVVLISSLIVIAPSVKGSKRIENK